MRTKGVESLVRAIRLFCLITGTVLLLTDQGTRVPAIGLALTGTACFWRRRAPGTIRSVAKLLVPVTVFLALYGLLLYCYAPAGPAASPPVNPLSLVAHLFVRSVGLLFAMFALDEALRPLALRARAGGVKGRRTALMLCLSYQLIPIFRQSLEGVCLSQRSVSRLWWLRPSRLLGAASSVFLLSYRLSEEMALALSLRLRHRESGGSGGSSLDIGQSKRPGTHPELTQGE